MGTERATKTRLRACDRWHPDVPSNLHIRRRVGGQGRMANCHVCNVCESTRAKIRNQGLNKPPPLSPPILTEGTMRQPIIRPYNVLPRLTWAPPTI